VTLVIRRKTNRWHVIDDHHTPDGRETTLLVRAMDDIFGTHRRKDIDDHDALTADPGHRRSSQYTQTSGTPHAA